MSQLKSGEVYNGKVIKINKTYVLINVEDIVGIVHISEISDYLIKDINSIFKLNEYYNFQFIKNLNDKHIFSYKRINAKLLKKRYTIIYDPKEFDDLMKNLDKYMKNNNY